MFLLIGTRDTYFNGYGHFNTSHVSINLLRQHKRENLFYISIHLMFLLILFAQLFLLLGGYFNTSHVSINRTSHTAGTPVRYNFNTSHVSINRNPLPSTANQRRISIHLMFLLIYLPKWRSCSAS